MMHYNYSMKPSTLSTILSLPDAELLARLPVLAGHERTAVASLVAHLAALRLRPSLHAGLGYGTLFAYCRRVLRLSEDAAANRIHAAKACLKFPVILDLLASGDLSLSAIRMLRRHLTAENHARILARARNARRVDIEKLVAELAPRPDVATSVRKLPTAPVLMPVGAATVQRVMAAPLTQPELPAMAGDASRPAPLDCGHSRGEVITADSGNYPTPMDGATARNIDGVGSPAPVGAAGLVTASKSRPVVQPLSPGRYRVQFTMGQESHDLLGRLQTLLRREVPDGDAGAIFERALRVLHEKVEAAKFGRPSKPKREASPRLTEPSAETYENRIRPGAGRGSSRYIPKAVKRAVWYRDRGQCAFVSSSGDRCGEREYLELHHIQPYALNGAATVNNVVLRCRAHNVFEAEAVFGTRNSSSVSWHVNEIGQWPGSVDSAAGDLRELPQASRPRVRPTADH